MNGTKRRDDGEVTGWRYDDIAGLKHFHAPGRTFMSNAARAAQFAPYKSLTGYNDIIDEEARGILAEGDEIVEYDAEYLLAEEDDIKYDAEYLENLEENGL